MADDLRFEIEDDWTWAADARLLSWRGFQDRGGAYGALGSGPSDGAVKLRLSRDGARADRPDDDDVAAARWVVAHEAEIAGALLADLLARWPALQARYGYEGEARAALTPDLADVEGFRPLIGLYAVNLHPVRRGGLPYAGFEFGCAWDAEHGLGVLMHGTRVVAVGGADTAILTWIAEQDAAKR